MKKFSRRAYPGYLRLLVAGAILASILIASGSARGQAKQRSTHSGEEMGRYDPARDAANDIRLAIAEARQGGKRILLDIGGEWCIWCRRLDTFFIKNSDAADLLRKNFIVVKVNVSKENENEKVLSSYPPVAGYPHLFVLDADGTLLRSQDTGALESGKFHDHDKVVAFLERWRAPSAKR
jgi:thiol:disulfide interchange protein